MSLPEESPQLPENDPDARLMIQVREGDAFAFEELMNRNQAKVFSLLTHFIGNRELAEDLTQEVFIKVYRARESYEPTAKFSTWLYRIVHNLALNAIRSQKRRPELLFGGVPASPSNESEKGGVENSILAQSGQTPTRQMDKKETQEIVRYAMGFLNERQRAALLYHRFEGLSYEQIAEVMSLTPQAVKSLLCRARLSLREILTPYFNEGRRPE